MNNTKLKSYRELIVWKKSLQLVVEIYNLTQKFPQSEIYGLTSQMRRAAISMPSNIAEGSLRGSRKDYLQFLRIAHGSDAELETQIEIAKKLSFGEKLDYNKASDSLNETMKMLHAIIAKLKILIPQPSHDTPRL